MKPGLKPDIKLDIFCFDPCARKAFGLSMPLSDSGEGQHNSGVYGFYDAGDKETTEQYVYIGKAVRLRNRIWIQLDGPAIREYWDDVFKDTRNLTGDLWVSVWFTEERAALERQLIDIYKPVYNRALP